MVDKLVIAVSPLCWQPFCALASFLFVEEKATERVARRRFSIDPLPLIDRYRMNGVADPAAADWPPSPRRPISSGRGANEESASSSSRRDTESTNVQRNETNKRTLRFIFFPFSLRFFRISFRHYCFLVSFFLSFCAARMSPTLWRPRSTRKKSSEKKVFFFREIKRSKDWGQVWVGNNRVTVSQSIEWEREVVNKSTLKLDRSTAHRSRDTRKKMKEKKTRRSEDWGEECFRAVDGRLISQSKSSASTEFYLVLPSFTEFYRVLSSFTEFYTVLPSFTLLTTSFPLFITSFTLSKRPPFPYLQPPLPYWQPPFC